MKNQPIRKGDKFIVGKDTWEVLRTWPGGHLELYCKARCMFQYRYHREVKLWKRENSPHAL